MINKKGFTVVEILVTFSFIMLISIGMLSIVSNYREKEQQEEIKKTMEMYKNEILKAVEDDILLYGVKSIDNLENAELDGSDRGIEINFKTSGISKKLLIYNRKISRVAYIVYDDIKYEAPDKFVNFVSDTILHTESVTNNLTKTDSKGYTYQLNKVIYGINIKIKHEESDENFDINIVVSKTEPKKIDCFTMRETTAIKYDYKMCGSNAYITPETVNGNKIEYITTSTFKSVVNPYTGKEIYTLNKIDFKNAKNLKAIPNAAFLYSHADIINLDSATSLTTIGNNAFTGNNANIIIIPNGVTTIGDGAFYNNSISSLTLGESVRTIEDNAFKDNSISGTLTIPNGVTTIGDGAFYNNSISSLTLGEKVETIGSYAFYYNKISGTLTIPNGVTTIGSSAFSNNSISGTLTIPNGVTTIGSSAFSNNSISGTLTIHNGVTTIGSSAFSNNSISSLTLGEKVETIGKSAFRNNLISGTLTIPNSVIIIGESAFYYNKIKSLILGSNIKTINKNAFYGRSGYSISTIDVNMTESAFARVTKTTPWYRGTPTFKYLPG